MTEAAMPENLKLALEHLTAVRELDRYLRKKGVEKDIGRYIKETFRPALEERLPAAIKSWTCGVDEDSIEWYPESWKLARDSHLSLYVCLPSPIDGGDPDPSVNLYVPTEWDGYSAFTTRSTPFVAALVAGGFGLAKEHDDWLEEVPVGKYVNWLTPNGTFDERDLIDRIIGEAKQIVDLELEITQTVCEFPAKPRHKKSKR
jgi:hypothetical protein